MKLQRTVIGVVISFGLSTGVCWATPSATTKWSPNKALLSQLTTAVTINKYQIQPPQGYDLRTQQGPSGSFGSYADAWVGPARTDGTHPYIMLGFLTPPAGEANKYTLKQVFAKMLAGVKHKRRDWKQSPVEQGRVNGMTFLRSYWQGVDIESGLPMFGFNYTARDGNTFLQLSSQDFTPYKKDALPLAETSALTFRKK